MKFDIVQEQQTINYSAGNPQTLTIGARSAWIVGFLLTLELAKTDAASPTTYQDFLYRSMTAILITGGKRAYVNVGAPDTRILYWHLRMRGTGRNRAPDMQAGSVTFRHQIPLLFGPSPVMANDRLNFFDVGAGIPPDQDLSIRVNWAANTAIGANRTIGTATLLRVAYIEAIPETDAEEPKFYPQWSSTQYTPPQTYRNLGGGVALDTNLWYRRSTVMTLLGASPADVRDDGLAGTAISEVGVKTGHGGTPLQLRTLDFAQASQGQFHVQDDNGSVAGATLAGGAASVAGSHNPGVGLIDWVQLADTRDPSVADPFYGLNLVGKKSTAARIGMTVDATANVSAVVFHEAYQRF